MKIFAKFLLSSVFVFLFAMGVEPLYAQTSLPCVDLQKGFDFEVGTQAPQEAIEHLQTKVKKMEACLEAMQFNASIYDAPLMVNQIDDNRKKLLTVETKLYETEERLRKAEEKIEILDLRLSALEPRARKAPVRNHAPDFIPDTQATTPHPASKKSDTSKPKAPTSKPKTSVNKPTPAVQVGTH